jgi:SPP1 gp7 family putative phage head morphogenesis protein
MPTSNEEIRDAFIRRQTRLLRMAAGTTKEARRLLNAVERDLRALIERRTQTLTGDRVRFGKTRTERLRKLREAIQELQGPTWKEIRTLMRETALEAGTLEAATTAQTIQAALPVVVSLELPSSQLLRSIVTSKPFEGKLLSRWVNEWEATDRSRIMDQIRIGLVQGETSTQISRRVFGTSVQRFQDGAREVTRRAAASISNTATNFITNEAREELFVKNKNLIPEVIYVATLDSRTTPICRSLDGKKFKTGEGPIPPLHFNCRSLRVPVLNGRLAGTRPANATTRRLLQGLSPEERARTVDRLVGQVPASENYATFLRKQSVDFQNDTMGVTKARLFRRGKLGLEKFVNQAGKELSIKDLRNLSVTDPDIRRAFELAGLQE